MNNKIIENIEFDTKVSDNFFVIKNKDKQVKNSDLINNKFELIHYAEVYYYGFVHLQFKEFIYLSFNNEHGFQLDFLIRTTTKPTLTQDIRTYLSNNFDDEILRTTIDVYEDAISIYPYCYSKNQKP